MCIYKEMLPIYIYIYIPQKCTHTLSIDCVLKKE